MKYTEHILFRMGEKGIEVAEVEAAIAHGEVIMEYLTDKPHPSKLILFLALRGPLHAVVGRDEVTEFCFVITAYWPDRKLWMDDFRRKPGKP